MNPQEQKNIQKEAGKFQKNLVKKEEKIFLSKDEMNPWAVLKEQAYLALKSGFLPQSIKTPEQAVIIALKGRELGIPTMQALSQINVIQGKPSLSAELILALIYRGCPTAEINTISRNEHECSIEARRKPADKFFKFQFTLDDAKKMLLDGKDNWRKQPKTMLHWRVVSMMGREMFPDCLMGASYTPDELQDGGEVQVEELPDGTIETTATVTAPAPIPATPEKTQTKANQEEKKPLTGAVPPKDASSPQRSSPPSATAPAPSPAKKLTEVQAKNYAQSVVKLGAVNGIDDNLFREYIHQKYSVASTKDLTEKQFLDLINKLRSFLPAKDGNREVIAQLEAFKFEVSLARPNTDEELLNDKGQEKLI